MPIPPAEPAFDLAAALAEGRAAGADRADPVGWQAVESLARRAARHRGAARGVMEQRIAERLAHLRSRAAVAPGVPSAERRGVALAALRALGAPVDRGGVGVAADPAGAAPELKALRDFRQRWQRLQAEHWLDQSLASAPDNAGPQNSHALAVRTLQQLQALSPAYVAALLVQLDALRWLEPDAAEPPLSGAGPRRARAARR